MEEWKSVSIAHQPIRTKIKAVKNFITHSHENAIFKRSILQANKDLEYGSTDKMVAYCGQSGFNLQYCINQTTELQSQPSVREGQEKGKFKVILSYIVHETLFQKH